MGPRVRFAPSPTGYLHIGGARTALFNWLYARRHGGVFVLRIEDTDVERSSADMVTGILDGLQWLGLTWDEGPGAGGAYGPYFQSERLARYQDAALRLVSTERAYYCYCSTDRSRDDAEQTERQPCTCRDLPAERRAELEQSGASRAVRFRVPAGRTSFDDAVHARIEFDNADIEDFVVLRSDGQPLYHLSVVVDDIDMAITHVIRGDDHISNTPKHVLLFEALGATPPTFAHVPLILGIDKKRLSKRHGATSVMEYRRLGYLPDAMVNFLALLGWSPGDDREVMSSQDLIEAFALDGISGGNAVFNPEKLDWMNGQYIAKMSADALAAAVRPLLEQADLSQSPVVREVPRFHRLLELLRPRAKRLTEFVDQAAWLLRAPAAYEPEAVGKHLSTPDLRAHVEALIDALGACTPFDESHIEAALRSTAERRGIKAGPLIHATRVAITGRTTSPGLFEVLALLGRDETLARLGRLQSFLEHETAAP